MSIIYLTLLSICLLFSSCASRNHPSTKAVADEFLSFSVKTYKKKHWHLASIGGFLGDPSVEQLTIQFFCEDKVNVDQARHMIIEGMEEFLEDINKNQKLRSHLCVVPFTEDHISFGIGFIENKETVPNPYVGYAFLLEGRKISYSTLNSEGTLFNKIHEETLEEALNIIAQEKQLTNNSLGREEAET